MNTFNFCFLSPPPRARSIWSFFQIPAKSILLTHQLLNRLEVRVYHVNIKLGCCGLHVKLRELMSRHMHAFLCLLLLFSNRCQVYECITRLCMNSTARANLLFLYEIHLHIHASSLVSKRIDMNVRAQTLFTLGKYYGEHVKSMLSSKPKRNHRGNRRPEHT